MSLSPEMRNILLKAIENVGQQYRALRSVNASVEARGLPTPFRQVVGLTEEEYVRIHAKDLRDKLLEAQ